MQTCSVLEDKQITKEIADFLASEKLRQSTKPNIEISLSAFERRLGQKFKCSAEIDRKRITDILNTIITARNKYLGSSSRGRPIQLFTLITIEPEIIERPKNFPQSETILSSKVPSPLNLSPCFSGRVQVHGENINTTYWPEGILLIPNFLTESQQLFFRNNMNISEPNSARFNCLLDLFSQYNFAPPVSGKTLTYQNSQHSPPRQIIANGTILFLSIGETVLLTFKIRGANIQIPLVSGSLLRIDSSLKDWNSQISPPKTGMNFMMEFIFSVPKSAQ